MEHPVFVVPHDGGFMCKHAKKNLQVGDKQDQNGKKWKVKLSYEDERISQM